MTSRTIRSGRSARAAASARAPSFANIGVKPASRSLKPNTSRASGSSSTSRIFAFIRLLAGVADILRLVKVHDFLRDVRRVISDALEALRNNHERETAG